MILEQERKENKFFDMEQEMKDSQDPRNQRNSFQSFPQNDRLGKSPSQSSELESKEETKLQLSSESVCTHIRHVKKLLNDREAENLVKLASVKKNRDVLLRAVRETFERDYFKYIKPKPIGQLSVRLLSAENLPTLDKDKYSDPFAFLQVEGKVHRTATVYNTNNPFWDRNNGGIEYAFDVSSPISVLRISMFDDDAYDGTIHGKDQIKETSRPKPMGEVVIPFDDFCNPGEITKKYFLQANEYKIKQHKLIYERLLSRLNEVGASTEEGKQLQSQIEVCYFLFCFVFFTR